MWNDLAKVHKSLAKGKVSSEAGLPKNRISDTIQEGVLDERGSDAPSKQVICYPSNLLFTEAQARSLKPRG